MSVSGIIFSNLHDGELPMLTVKRTMGAVPFGGRYRLIDFPLSAMVNAGISNIAVIAHHNYQSLMEHIGSGKDWDLARHAGGIRIVPPYSAAYQVREESYDSRMETLLSIRGMIDRIKEEHILFADCDVVGTPELKGLIEAHRRGEAPITVGTEHDGYADEGPSLHIFIVDSAYFKEILFEAEQKAYRSFTEDIVRRQMRRGMVATYRFENRFYRMRSLAEYYRLHMLLTGKGGAREELLQKSNCPIYTRILNAPPVKYGSEARVKNALIADGCMVEGEVINSVIFRGVHIGKGCSVRNAVLMENCILAGNATVDSVVLDKGVSLGSGVALHGHESMPLFVEEGRKIV
ncbi:MAG: hypothetical protein E7663_00510 [Ruminococcaceae bacterium]|nr:hypothetical protein [Oscillospiraceae bacterium]